ncbi:MAG: HEAT repeat domain-containing protein [Actinomycetes bacterium]
MHPEPADDPTAPDRRRRVVVAGHLGDGTTARAGLADPDPAVRAAAVGALDRCAALGADQLRADELAAALDDVDRGVRRRAALVAARRDDVAPELLSLLDDPDGTVVEVAAFAWGERADGAAAVPRLAELATTHDDALCREAAVAALGSLGDPAGLDAVLAGCADRATVRRRAVLALAAFEGSQVTAMLEHLREDRDLQVRQAAEDLLAIERGLDV